MAQIVIKDNNMSADLGRITVAYIADQDCIRVVLSETGECLREDECGQMNIAAFRSVVQMYEKMININH